MALIIYKLLFYPSQIEDTNLKHCHMISDWEQDPPQPEQLVQISIKLVLISD